MHGQNLVDRELEPFDVVVKSHTVWIGLRRWSGTGCCRRKDIGLYQDPYSDYGRLENDIWRAIRLVVDTGVHSQHWTRQQMVDYFHDHSAIDETDIQTEVDRYIAWPSQALAYKIGQLEILGLRDKAKTELGDKFDLRAFHDQVIDSGALPLDVLDERIQAWIGSQKTAAK